MKFLVLAAGAQPGVGAGS